MIKKVIAVAVAAAISIVVTVHLFVTANEQTAKERQAEIDLAARRAQQQAVVQDMKTLLGKPQIEDTPQPKP